jgi:lysophospholipase L1-like esterase
MHPKKTTVPKQIIFFLIGLGSLGTLGVLLLELTFGYWLRDDPWKRTEHLYIIRNAKFHWNTEAIYGQDTPRVTYSRNQYGLRDECGAPSNIKILTIGGSTTDQRYINDGQTYQDVLQNKIEKNLGVRACISNAGVDGQSTFGHIETLRKWLPLIEGLRPNVVILYLGINDAAFRFEARGFDLFEDRIDYTPPTWKDKSALVNLLRKIRASIAIHKGQSNVQTSVVFAEHKANLPREADYTAVLPTANVGSLIEKNTDEFSKRLNKIIELIQRNYRATVICITQPHLLTKNGIGLNQAFVFQGTSYSGLDYDLSLRSLNKKMAGECSANGTLFIDLSDVDFDTSDFYDSVHLNHKGTEKLGNALFYKLSKLGITKLIH